MALASLSLVVLAAFVHAGWNLLAKRAAPVGPVFLFACNLVSCIAYAPWAITLLATGGGIPWTAAGAGFLLLSGLIHFAYSLCLQRGYQLADLSVVYPVARGTGPMLSSLGAFLALGETPTGSGLAGLLLVILGILFIATRGELGAFTRPGGQTGLRWGTATGGLIACYTVIDAYAVTVLDIAPVLLDWFSSLLRLVLLLPLVLSDRGGAMAAMRGYWPIAFAVGLLAPVSYILVLVALSSGAPLSLVAPMREMSMMVGALMGMLVLREQVGVWRLIGCGVLIAGVILLSAS